MGRNRVKLGVFGGRGRIGGEKNRRCAKVGPADHEDAANLAI
jgi:hypothetical protein